MLLGKDGKTYCDSAQSARASGVIFTLWWDARGQTGAFDRMETTPIPEPSFSRAGVLHSPIVERSPLQTGRNSRADRPVQPVAVR